MIQVSLVPTEFIDSCWDKISGYLDGAAEYTYGRYKTSNIYDAVKDGDYLLWVAFDENDNFKAAVVTNFAVYPQKKMLCMQFCGGEEIELWKDPMLALLRKFAIEMGCDGIESTGRPGWAKVFQNDGYKATWVTYELPLQMEKK